MCESVRASMHKHRIYKYIYMTAPLALKGITTLLNCKVAEVCAILYMCIYSSCSFGLKNVRCHVCLLVS